MWGWLMLYGGGELLEQVEVLTDLQLIHPLAHLPQVLPVPPLLVLQAQTKAYFMHQGPNSNRKTKG